MMPLEKPIYLLAGPTASGKSAHALEWAQKHNGHILNADSMQHYAHLSILTARPSREDEAILPHHLYGHLSPDETWSAGVWVRAAMPYITAALNGGPPLCIVGGTGLYFNALTKGLAVMPNVSSSIRDLTEAAYDRDGEDRFRQRLHQIDPMAEARIAPNDRQRLVRALSVYEATGTSLTDFQANTTPILGAESYRLEILLPDRASLYARCDQRFNAMIDQGALDEIKDLIKAGLKLDWPIMRVLGVRPLYGYLLGQITLQEAISQSQQATRNYAKRQMTWFRNQFQSLD